MSPLFNAWDQNSARTMTIDEFEVDWSAFENRPEKPAPVSRDETGTMTDQEVQTSDQGDDLESTDIPESIFGKLY